MTFPLDLQIGSSIVPIHTIFELLSFFIGYRYFVYLKNHKKIDPLSPRSEWWIVIGMAIGAFVGSRLVAGLENPTLFVHPLTWLYYIGGQTIAGGLAGGIVGVEITKKILKIKRRTGDLFVYPLLLGIIIGRVGCFLTGVKDGTVGLASNLPWAFDQGDGIPRHPTSLYEMLFLMILWVMLKSISKRMLLKEGDLFRIFIVSYSLFRLFVEFIKPRNPLFLDLSSIQLLAVVLVVHYGIYFIKQRNKITWSHQK